MIDPGKAARRMCEEHPQDARHAEIADHQPPDIVGRYPKLAVELQHGGGGSIEYHSEEERQNGTKNRAPG